VTCVLNMLWICFLEPGVSAWLEMLTISWLSLVYYFLPSLYYYKLLVVVHLKLLEELFNFCHLIMLIFVLHPVCPSYAILMKFCSVLADAFPGQCVFSILSIAVTYM
jgi:hypothetical protein